MTDLYIAQHEGLVTVHRALAEAFAPIVAGATTPLETLIPAARAAAGFLMGHHYMESSHLFAGLRRHGRLRSSDVGFLDARDKEHHDIHALCESLMSTCGALHPHSATIAREARELMDILLPHTREEEEGLAPARLRLMIDERGLAELQRDLEAAREEAFRRQAAAAS